MRLKDTHQTVTLPHGTSGLRDMQQLFGGSRKWSRGLRAYSSDDERAYGWQYPFWRKGGPDDSKATLTLEKLNLRAQARRWTALQAYNTQAGQHLTKLSLEAYGVDFAREFAEYCAEGEHRSEQLVHARGIEVYPDPLEALPDGAEVPPGTVSVFKIEREQGGTLPELAHTIADYYGHMDAYKVRHFGDEGNCLERASNEVARALGASSMDHLNEAWQAGMRAADPLEAGHAVLVRLSVDS